jgi:hypothetical protein
MEIMAGVECYRRAKQYGERQYIQHPHRWLNGEGWLNEYPGGTGKLLFQPNHAAILFAIRPAILASDSLKSGEGKPTFHLGKLA